MKIPLVLLWFITCGFGYPEFQAKIPNGNKVRDPCNREIIWQAVGHQVAPGGGLRNSFGSDSYRNNMEWNKALCMKDSDSDGKTNGEELGDPSCVWVPGTLPSNNVTGHPGICEPLDHPGCTQINVWYSCQNRDLDCDATKSPDVMNMTVALPETPVPATETTYICVNFEFPNDTDYHIIADKGAIVNHNVTHHILIHGCPAGVTLSDLKHPLNTPYTCGMQEEDKCLDIISILTVGLPGFCHNENAGFKIGKTGYRYGSLQIHWNNPLKSPDYVDSSGITFFYTPILRPYDLGNLLLGEHAFEIPPGEKAYTIESECSDVCSSRLMNDSIFVTSGFNHMHYMGKEMVTSFFSDGVQQMSMEDLKYSYDSPVIHTFRNPLEITPGDVIKTKCTFQSTHKNVTTFRGHATSDEMCYSFLIYYPKQALKYHHCMTKNTLPMCSFTSYTDIVHGCQMRSFYEDFGTIMHMLQQIKNLCTGYMCRKECKEYVKMVRQNPCLQGEVGEYMMSSIRENYKVTADTMLLYHSCDVELALEVNKNTCQCTSSTLDACDHRTDKADVAYPALVHIVFAVLGTVFLN